MFRYFDADFVRGVTEVDHLADLGHGQQFVSHLVGPAFPGKIIEVAVQRDKYDRYLGVDLEYDRLLGQQRKGLNGIDACLDFRQDLVHVEIHRNLDGDSPHSLRCHGVDLGYALDILDGLLDLDDNAFLNFLRRRTQVRNLNLHEIQFEIRCRLFANREDGNQSGDNDEHH